MINASNMSASKPNTIYDTSKLGNVVTGIAISCHLLLVMLLIMLVS